MDIVRIVGSSLGFIHALVDLLDKNKKLAKDLSDGLNFIQMDLEMIKNLLEQDEQLHLQPEMQLKLQELAYDIDDFVKGLCVPKPFSGFFLTATGSDIRPESISSIEQLKSRATDLGSKLEKSFEQMKSGGSAPAKKKRKKSGGRLTSTVSSASPSSGSSGYLVGIGEPKKEIGDLLSSRHETLKVISIVGCSGLGKTTLAKALYKDEEVVNKFDHKAWIVASDNSPADNLNKILQQLHRPPAPESTSEDLQHVPKNKRYLFVLDDVQQSGIVWKDIEEAFRGNKKGSRIILTTRAHSVAAACSPGSHLYRMKCLGPKESEELLWTKAMNCPGAPKHLSKCYEEIISKCGGLPLALISAGEYLSLRGLDLNRDHCADLGRSLGKHLVGDGKLEVAFQEMKRALVESYEKLTKHDHRNCLLYLSIFPRGHHINSKSLIRKLIAEELVGENGRLCLDELIDQGMIEEVLSHDDCDSEVAVEGCKAHSVVLEYTIKKALARNFVSLVHEKELLHNPLGLVRRLTVQSDYKVEHDETEKQVKLSSLRSLTIFDTGILDFKNCRVIQVLDLEGCNWINTKVVDETCELVFLKYLSLRNTGITILPKKIKNLVCLETMDIRDTSVKILPIEVILLPRLAFLFGRFELPKLKEEGQNWFEKFLQTKSKLKTLAGIVINSTNNFEIIIVHARHLEKVKIWFKVVEVEPSCRRKSAAFSRGHKTPGSSLEETNTGLAGILVSSLQKRFNKIESVSIHFNWSKHQTKIKDFLGSMHANCIISSIKLWGKLESLPEPDVLTQLGNIRKLHLFNTGLTIEDLSVLQNLKYLEYLKIAEDQVGHWGGEFVVREDGFPCLHLLSLEAPKLPKVIFQKGSMPCLNSLQLLCPGSSVKVEDISDLPRLNEVILHHSAPDTTVDAWKDAAALHVNRPFVRKQVISKKRKEPPTNIIAS